MKRYFIISLLATMAIQCADACVSEGPTHNHYMFSVFNRNAVSDGPEYIYGINKYWQGYANKPQSANTDFYKWNKDEIMAAAKHKGDKEMTAYLALLNRYLSVCDAYTYDQWEYPTKQQIAQRQQTLASVNKAAKAYNGSKLRQQYILLQMRTNMLAGNDAANMALWKSTVANMAPSVWREAMRNIYAHALLKSGQQDKACDIYAEQGDIQSIKFVMRHYRNLAGIRNVFAKNHNAPTLEYLVQDFVNNVQETIDLKPQSKDDEEWFKEIDAKAIYRKEAMQFVAFARNAANTTGVKSPCLWLTAASMVDYLLGNQPKAMSEANLAVRAKGAGRIADNARSIRLLVSTRSNKPTTDYMEYLLTEFKWLDSMAVAERGTSDEYSNHYTDVKDRVVHKGLEPLFRNSGMDDAALAICAMMSAENGNTMSYGPWDEYFCKMDSLNADRLAEYYKYISSPHDNAFESYCTSQTYHDANYFNDLIGTKMIAEGRFSDAINYLEKVSTDFLSQQLISVYAAKRHYDTPRWFGKQTVEDTYEPVAVTKNIKLDFCRDMSKMLAKYDLSRDGEAKEQMAYELAVRYYQASCYGDCWFLTHYYHSVEDSARSWEKDFAAEAVKYLKTAKRSANLTLRYKATYATAFIPADPWLLTTYDDDYNEVFVPNAQSAQYRALKELDIFARTYPKVIDDYTRHCDILRKFTGLYNN